jgi:hypothetical protein
MPVSRRQSARLQEKQAPKQGQTVEEYLRDACQREMDKFSLYTEQKIEAFQKEAQKSRKAILEHEQEN